MKNLTALISGLVFGLGIAISGMAIPAKVLNLFDVAGTWDPSLIFVMGGALVTAMIGYRFVFGAQSRPLFEPSFLLPQNRTVDRNLVGGSALFGIGWGIAGFCPGGAIPALGFGGIETALFVTSLIGGMLIGRALRDMPKRPVLAKP